ncbi:MAG: hypothetical protein FWH35_03455 [Treponema sp.]|nr:hypothetical protein [Treponema sp.]
MIKINKLTNFLNITGILVIIVLLAGCAAAGAEDTSTTVWFNNLYADGSGTATTTKLFLTFEMDISDLEARDITLSSGNTGASKGELTKTAYREYELVLNGIKKSGEVTVAVSKSGYSFTPAKRNVWIYYSGPSLEEARFISLDADGSAIATTTKLFLSFNIDIAGLKAADISLSSGITGATKGALTRTGYGEYELALNGIIEAGEVTAAVRKNGYSFTPAARSIWVYYYLEQPPVEAGFISLDADGSAIATTTKLTLTFDMDIDGLEAKDITLSSGSTGATKGTLTRTGSGEYELELSGITKYGEITASVSKSGYNFTPAGRNVYIYFYPSTAGNIAITFAQITDEAPVFITPITIYRSGKNGPTTATITVVNPSQYSKITWSINGITGQGTSFILDSSTGNYNSIGQHLLGLEVIKGGKPYNKNISFIVEN